jgi:uncharacterized protein YaiE (UPF0345 family)
MAGYIGTTPVPQATQHRESFTATGGQTSFATVGYTPQFIDVYLNGVKLAPADFTATNGSDVVLASGATASDILEIVAYTPFEVANQTFTGTTTAANLTVTGAFTSQGIDDNADAVAITIDSSENVGIGTSSVDSLLHLQKSDATAYSATASDGQVGVGPTIYLENPANSNSTVGGQIVFGMRSTEEQARIGATGGAAPALTFGTGDAEAMRISSGNLLVGKTSADNGATVGVELRGDISKLYVTDSASSPLIANRLTSDGNIAVFQKDGTTVGSIGVYESDRLYIADQSNGLQFDQTIIRPCNNTGANTDDVVTLGTSGARFKDLYLSGGVYLGGTGAANKLTDYETGTWTPSSSHVTLSQSSGVYVKVGRLVNFTGHLVFPSSGSGTDILINGLPFTLGAGNEYRGGGTIGFQNSGLNNVTILLTSNSTSIKIYSVGSAADYSQFSGKSLYFGGSYITS